MRKSILFILLALMLSVTMTVAQEDIESIDPSGQTIVYWHQFTSAQAETMTSLVETFNANNEYGITVEMIHQGNYDDIRNLMSGAIISGDLPNVVAGYQNDAASYALDGAAVDLNPYIASEAWGLGDMAGDINEAILAANTFTNEPFAGEILAWPHQNSAQVLVVNMDMLRELGFEAPPTTFEEFQAISCAAAELTGPNGEDIQGFPLPSDASMYESFVAAHGGQIFHDGAYDFTSAPAVESLQLFQNLYSQGCGYVPDRPFGNTGDFALGLNPMATTSTAGFTFIIGDIATAGLDFEWIVTTLPWTEGNKALQVFVPSIIMVPATPEQQLASWIFLKYLTTAEAGATWSQGTGYFTPVRSAAELITAENFPNQALFPYFSAANEIQNSDDINIYVAPNVTSYGTVRGLISEAVSAVTVGGEEAQAAAEALQEAATEALEDN